MRVSGFLWLVSWSSHQFNRKQKQNENTKQNKTTRPKIRIARGSAELELIKEALSVLMLCAPSNRRVIRKWRTWEVFLYFVRFLVKKNWLSFYYYYYY